VAVVSPASDAALKAAESSAPAAGSSPAKETPAEPKSSVATVSASADAKNELPPETKPEPKPTAKPEESKPVAKSAPAKTVPKPEAKPEPFKGLASAVTLPDLPEKEGQPATDALSPLVLGPCNVDEKAPLVITLLGGETASRSTRQKFELQPRAGSPRDWDFVQAGGQAPVTIANLSVKDGNLIFQWTEEGVKPALAAKQLCNCALKLEAGSARQTVALRTAVQGPPLIVEIDKPGGGVKWNIGDLPLAKQLSIEITRLEEIKAHKQEPPKGPVTVGESMTVWTGPTEKIAPLGLKLATSATARAIEVKLVPQVKLEGQETSTYRKKEMQSLKTQVDTELPFLEQQIEQAKRAQPSRSNPVKAALDKKQIDDRKATLAVQRTQKLTVQEQLSYLVGWAETFRNTAKIHFRVYTQAGDAKIELLRTDEQPVEKSK